MQLITRATSIAGTLLFTSGEIIPYYGWGLWVLCALVVVMIVAFLLCIKYAKELNVFFDKIINKMAIKLKRKK